MNEDTRVVYAGPNVLSLGLQASQVFVDGLPPNVEDAINKIPEVKALIVPIDSLWEVRAKVKRNGSYESKLYETIHTKAAALAVKKRK